MPAQKRAVKINKKGQECFEVKGYTRPDGSTVQGYTRCLGRGERKKETRIKTGRTPMLRGSAFSTVQHNTRTSKAATAKRQMDVEKAIEQYKASIRLRKHPTGKEILTLIRKIG